jgi:hypothetical protein
MTYEQMKDLKPETFKRACGVHPHTFEKMLAVLRDNEQRKIKPGRPPTLSLEDQLLMALQYWREYRTYFHIGLSWGLAESVVCRTVHRIENLLIKHKICDCGSVFDVIVVFFAESPVERPQKNSVHTIVGRRNATPRKRRLSLPKRRVQSSVSPSARDASTISACSNEARSPSRKT